MSRQNIILSLSGVCLLIIGLAVGNSLPQGALNFSIQKQTDLTPYALLQTSNTLVPDTVKSDLYFDTLHRLFDQAYTDKNLQTYTNPTYHFTIQVPKNYKQVSLPVTDGSDTNTQVLATVEFNDPSEDQLNKCTNAFVYTLVSSGSSSTNCRTIFSAMSPTVAKSLEFAWTPNNIFVRVEKNPDHKDVSQWLIDTYRIPNSDLESYTPGGIVASTTSDLKFYRSLIDHSPTRDLSLVTSSGDYIYEIGTNSHDLDDQSLQNVVNTFSVSGN